jgi:G3E family GTPase
MSGTDGLSRVTDQTTSIPVNVITGFLGSGKTSLLRRLLASPALADTAVLVNEFGEVGLDHHLLQRVDDEIVLLQSGCLCCTIRGDLSTAMRKLYARREKGEVQPFRRLVVETTGLADPVPILSTVMAEPVLRYHFRLGNVVTTVDGVTLNASLNRPSRPRWQTVLSSLKRTLPARARLPNYAGA